MNAITDEVLTFKTLVVVGLGNPGSKYDGTRHNVGFQLLDRIAGKFNCQLRADNEKASGLTTITGADINDARSVMLVKPLTYMNRSGEPLQRLCAQKGYHYDQLLVLHDELDLPLGTVRLKVGGGEGGHNGLRSISASFGTKNYARLRIGIGKPDHPDYQITDWVLGKFMNAEKELLETCLSRAEEAVERLLSAPSLIEGRVKAQNWLNSF